MRSRILVGLIAGTIGGFLGWLLQENLINYNAFVVQGVLPGQAVLRSGIGAAEMRTLVFCVGGLIGLFLGAVDGIVEGNARKLLQGIFFGALFGILLGFIGFYLGNLVFNLLGGESEGVPRPGIGAFAQQVIARAFGWAFMGLGLGIGSGLVTRSPKRIWHGAIGGFLGGFLGGCVFDLLALSTNPVQEAVGASGPRDIGGPSRMVGFTAIGGLTGFFIGLVEELLKQAWVKVLAGRNEGKEFILSKPMEILGRDERCDVPLYGDPSVGLQHAAIRADGNRHLLLDANTPLGTLVNGQRVNPNEELLLRDGDMIQIGMHRVLFREKATASKIARPVTDVPKAPSGSPASSVPMPSHLCPFCGAPKNAAGECLCTVAGSPAPVGAPGSGRNVSGYGGAGVDPNVRGYSLGTPNVAYGGAGAAMPGVGPARGGMSEMPRLVGMEGPYAGQVFLLTSPNMMVGREPDKDIVLSADTTVSRSHARIVNESGDLVVYDNNSANGTYINGMRISMQILTPGDAVQFGSSKFRYE
jgi:pSer/pThr/pTyr-binding forkhead associated (FHA) protein